MPTAEDIRQLAVEGAGATVLSNGLGTGMQIIATVILARLLTPADFGVVTMVTTFSLLFLNFGLNGFTEAVIQWPEINDGLASNLFWINLGAGVLLTAGFSAAGSLLAWFYHNALVVNVAVGMSLTILITSSSVLHLALLKRAMRFSLVSVNDVFARAVFVAVSILCAWAGWGYWALVAGNIGQALSQSIGAWLMCRWTPSLPRRVAATGSMVKFAMHVYGRFGLNYGARNVDNLLVGWRFDAKALGFYKKAYDLFSLSATVVVSSLTVVAVSALRRFTPGSIPYRKYLLNAIGVLAFVGMAVGADLTLVGKDLIRLLLGPSWEEAGRIFTYFGPGIGIMFLYYSHGWIHLSIGRADRWFRWGIAEFVFTSLLFILGLPWGPVGVALAWTASSWILVIPAFWYAGKPIGLGIGPVFAAVWKYVLASLLSGTASAVIIRATPSFVALPWEAEALLRIVSISVLFVALYLGVVILLHGGSAPLLQIAGLLKEMVPWRNPLIGVPIESPVTSLSTECATLSATRAAEATTSSE